MEIKFFSVEEQEEPPDPEEPPSGSYATTPSPPTCHLNPTDFCLRHFSFATERDWNDWRWQLRYRITTKEQLEKIINFLMMKDRP